MVQTPVGLIEIVSPSRDRSIAASNGARVASSQEHPADMMSCAGPGHMDADGWTHNILSRPIARAPRDASAAASGRRCSVCARVPGQDVAVSFAATGHERIVAMGAKHAPRKEQCPGDAFHGCWSHRPCISLLLSIRCQPIHYSIEQLDGPAGRLIGFLLTAASAPSWLASHIYNANKAAGYFWYTAAVFTAGN